VSTLKSQPIAFSSQWRGQMSEYVTSLAWSPEGTLAAGSANGQILLWRDQEEIELRGDTGGSIDALDFSSDGRFLAAGGQDGRVTVWQMSPLPEIIATLDNSPYWVDQLSWCPNQPDLAFSIGKYLQIWNATERAIVSTLPFLSSSVFGLAWRADGTALAVAGDGGVKVWDARDWNDDPYEVDLPAASITVAWSGDGRFLASSSLDHTITVLQWGNPHPWVMRGFPGKIRALAWSGTRKNSAPLLAAASLDGIVVWTKGKTDQEGWDGQVLTGHEGVIQAIAFQPNSSLLASVGEDDRLTLWRGKQLLQTINGAGNGFSTLAWEPSGERLATGGQGGELTIWAPTSRGRGFQSRK
jgi:WD40 repeat protein